MGASNTVHQNHVARLSNLLMQCHTSREPKRIGPAQLEELFPFWPLGGYCASELCEEKLAA